MIIKPVQRHYSLESALALAQECAEQNHIDFNIQKLENNEGLVTILCTAEDHQQKIAFRGSGSGTDLEATIKALYEALEECFCYRILKNNNTLKLHKIFSTKCMDYPVGLMFPHSNEKTQAKIANTTGIAMGATLNEAIIHGINDWIERDAYGLFLLNTVLKKNRPANKIIKDSLPNHIQNMIHKIETLHKDQLHIIDITSNIEIPAFFVSFIAQPVPVQPSGLGASLFKEDALMQALLEALQARDRYNPNTVTSREKTLHQYQNQPLLREAFECNLCNLKYIHVDWNTIVSYTHDKNLEDQIKIMANMCKKNHCQIYFNTLMTAKNGLSLSYVKLIGAETFGMMREGLFFPITKRGLEFVA